MEAPPVKPREERQKVMVKARMRSGASWRDVCILNVSIHGLGIQSADPLERGTYVEICRGTQSIVARVAWCKGHRAGLRSQDATFIKALVNEALAPPERLPTVSGRPVERRRIQRTAAQRHERSRLVGRAFEFACFGLVAMAIAMAAFGTVEQAFAAPLSRISSALG